MADRRFKVVSTWNKAVEEVKADDKFVIREIECFLSEYELLECGLSLQSDQYPKPTFFVLRRDQLVKLAKDILHELEPTVEDEILDTLRDIRKALNRRGYSL